MDAQQQTHGPESSMNQQSGGKTFRDQANEALRKAGETAQQAQGQAKETISNLSTHAAGTVKELLNHQVNAGADFASDIAHSIRCAADDLSHSAPQLGEFAHEAARQVDVFAARMRETPADELFADASEFARRQPAVVFGAAAVLGFAMFRMLKVGTQGSSRGSDERDRFAPDPGQWPQGGQSEDMLRSQFGAAG